ncbi:unnamed protein product [Lota lota]
MLSFFVPIISLSNLLFLYCVDSLHCSEKEYAWPVDSQHCCLKCPPGKYLRGRCSSNHIESRCESCPTGQYTNSFNTEPSCPFCSTCNPSLWLEEESPCQTNQNTVCRCQLGFTCKSQPCQECELTMQTPTKWLLVIGGTLLATGLLLLMFQCVFLHIKIKCGVYLCRSTGHDSIESAEEEKECLPVQEMCDKHEQQTVDV